MESAIVVTVRLKGILGKSVKHTTTQTGQVDISPIGKSSQFITRTILHTDRTPVACSKIIPISEKVVTEWVRGNSPYWEKPNIWKKYNKQQKIMSYLSRMDEGYGISYE